MAETVNLSKQRNVKLQDRVKYLASKLGILTSKCNEICQGITECRFFYQYVPNFGIDSDRIPRLSLG